MQLRRRHVKHLSIRVHSQEVDTGDAALDHAVDGIRPASTNAYYLDLRVLISHSMPPLCLLKT